MQLFLETERVVMKYKVLIAGCGNVTGMNVIRALKDQDDITVYGCDFDKENPANLFCETIEVPRCADVNYPDSIKKIIREKGITHIIASNDHDVRALTELKKSNVEFPILNCYGEHTIDCLDKKATQSLFQKAGVETPQIINCRNDYPYVLRIENMGKRKKFVHIVQNGEDAECILEEEYEAGIMTRYVSGTEYTIDVLSDSNSNMLVAVPRERINVVGGMVHHARIMRDDVMIKQCAMIVESVGLKGMSCIQCIKTENNHYYFIEINPRPGSGIDLSINSGVNMPLLWIKESGGEKVEVPSPKWGMQMKRFFSGYYY